MTASNLRRDAVENRAALLDAARTVLNSDPAASLDQVAQAAGLSRRSVYGHFPTRDALLRELIGWRATAIARELEALQVADPLLRLALISSRIWSSAADHRTLSLVASTIRTDGDDIVDGLGPLRAMVLDAVSAGQHAGVVRTDLDAGALARLAESAVLGAAEEGVRRELDGTEGRRLAVLVGLAVAGLDWRAAQAFVAAHEELLADPPEDAYTARDHLGSTR